MPVLNARQYVDNVANFYLADRGAFFLVIAGALYYNQYLVTWVGMPVIATAGFKYHFAYSTIGNFVCHYPHF